MVETSEIDGAHGLPRDTTSLTNDLKQVLHYIVKKIISNVIKHKYTQRYALRVTEWVNKEEVKVEGKKRKTKTGMIKVSGLSHKREKQRDPRIACIMFQNIYLMYRDINNKEERSSAMIITSMSEHEQSKKLNKELGDTRDNTENNQKFLQNMNIPSDLNGINQDPPRYGTVMKLGLIPMEGETRSSVLTCYFNVNRCGRFKLEREHHYGACYLSLAKPMVNAPSQPYLSI